MGEHALQRPPPSYPTETLETLWYLDRQILPIPPLLPRPDEVAQVRIAEQAQRQVGVRGAVPALSKGHHGVVRVNTRCGVHGPQFLGGFKSAVSVSHRLRTCDSGTSSAARQTCTSSLCKVSVCGAEYQEEESRLCSYLYALTAPFFAAD